MESITWEIVSGGRGWMRQSLFCFVFFPRRAHDFSSLAVLLPFTTRGDYHSLCSEKERWKEMCAHVFQHLGQRCGRCSVHSSQLISCCQDVNRLLPSFFFLFHHCSDSFCFSSCCSEPDQAPGLERTSIMTIPMSSLKILGLLSFKKKKSQLIQILPQIIIICNNWSRWRSTSPSPLCLKPAASCCQSFLDVFKQLPFCREEVLPWTPAPVIPFTTLSFQNSLERRADVV